MTKTYCNAKQAVTPKLIPTLALLFLVSVSLLTQAGVLTETQAQSPQLQNIEPTQVPGRRIQSGELPDGLSSGAWASIQGQIAAGKYRVYPHESDGFVSSNPAHGWRIYYSGDGTTTLRPRDRQAQAYYLGLKLRAVGYTEPQTLVRPEQISADDSIVTYQWNDYLQEWWVNSASDLEQWFELEQRPPGAVTGQPLILELTLATDLKASQQGNALSFVNDSGISITYNKLKVWDTSGRELPARMQLAADTLSLVIDDSAASYPLTIDPSFEQQAYVKAPNTGFGDDFGFSVAISGNTLVVGAIGEDSNATGINGDQSDNSALNSGAAYVFTRSGTTWSQQAYLKASNTDTGDTFGLSVAISGNTLVVGAEAEDSNATGIDGDQDNILAIDSGAAYVFTRSGTTWTQQAYLKASNTGSSDEFGKSVSISGDTLVIGARLEDSNATGIDGDQDNFLAFDSGAAYVFTRSGTTWSQQAYVKASNTGGADEFGRSVAIFGNTLVVGAPLEDSDATGIDGDQSDNSALDSGSAYVVFVTRDFTINAGLNDAWVSADAPFQGFFFTVFPELEFFFLSWFTFDSVLPDDSVTAVFGAPDQRWVTAGGAYSGDTATLSVELTSGGVFNSSDPLAIQEPGYGTITIVFVSCNEALLTYDFPSVGLSGEMTLTRVLTDNVALCEALAAP